MRDTTCICFSSLTSTPLCVRVRMNSHATWLPSLFKVMCVLSILRRRRLWQFALKLLHPTIHQIQKLRFNSHATWLIHRWHDWFTCIFATATSWLFMLNLDECRSMRHSAPLLWVLWHFWCSSMCFSRANPKLVEITHHSMEWNDTYICMEDVWDDACRKALSACVFVMGTVPLHRARSTRSRYRAAKTHRMP